MAPVESHVDILKPRSPSPKAQSLVLATRLLLLLQKRGQIETHLETRGVSIAQKAFLSSLATLFTIGLNFHMEIWLKSSRHQLHTLIVCLTDSEVEDKCRPRFHSLHFSHRRHHRNNGQLIKKTCPSTLFTHRCCAISFYLF